MEIAYDETVAINRSAQLKVFADFEQAIAWLVMRKMS